MTIIPLSKIRKFVLAQKNDRPVNLMNTSVSEIGKNGYLGCLLGQYCKSHKIPVASCNFYDAAQHEVDPVSGDKTRKVIAHIENNGHVLEIFDPVKFPATMWEGVITYGTLKKALKVD